MTMPSVDAEAQQGQATIELYPGGWWPVPGLTSAQVAAREDVKLLSSGGNSWPDGSQAIFTFWLINDKLIVRCLDYFDRRMEQTGGFCYQPKATLKSPAAALAGHAYALRALMGPGKLPVLLYEPLMSVGRPPGALDTLGLACGP
jgi:hypothetical protein